MRSVIRNPLTILVTAAVIAINPSTLLSVVASPEPVITIAPTTEMAEIALVSDCSSGDTLRMISRPTKVASMKTMRPISRLLGIERSHAFPHPRMHDLALVRDESFADDLIVAIQRELTVLDQVFEKSRDVLGVHLTRVVRDCRGQVEGAEDADAVLFDGFAGLCQFAVAAAL